VGKLRKQANTLHSVPKVTRLGAHYNRGACIRQSHYVHNACEL